MFYRINYFLSFISIITFFASWILTCVSDIQIIDTVYSFSQLCIISFYFIIFLMHILYRDGNIANINDLLFDVFIIIFVLIDKDFLLLPPYIKKMNIEFFLIAIRICFLRKSHLQNIRLMRHPERSVVVSYVATIFYGTLLLSLPFSWQPNVPHSFIDAFFTSTSASCITGLTSVDISKSFSLAGQIIICSLAQIGGIGIMIFYTIIAFTFSKHFSLEEARAASADINENDISSIQKIIPQIILIVFIFEGIGFIFFLMKFITMFPLPKALYYAAFHSVSAFCNAGFSLFSDNLMQFYNSPLVIFTVSFLVISGGLGFHVIRNIFFCLHSRIKHKSLYKRKILTETSKIILCGTIFLLLAGTYLFYALEHKNTLRTLSTPVQYLTAFFQSVTLRSSGFNSVNFSQLTHATQIMMLVFMLIGAGPGSTGGGIKITSFVILCASVYAYMKENKQTVLFRKAVRPEITRKVFISFFYSIGMIFLGLFFLALSAPNADVLDLLFETTSAFATVGVSTGITSQLHFNGKLILIFLMFAGKVGTLTLFSAVTLKKSNTKIEYPSANINIG
ncbi:MAG: hypothetical protein J1G30_05490 [Spirochaetales bacterium]|nr:hypothetical protein [Spirochaetales bacterium]